MTDHLNAARPLIDGPDGTRELRDLNLAAGRRARDAAAHEAADAYLRAAVDLVAERDWQSALAEVLRIHAEAAESACAVGDYPRCDALLERALDAAAAPEHTTLLNRVKLDSLSAQGRHTEALDLGRALLAERGRRYPARPGRRHALAAFARLRWRMRDVSLDTLRALPDLVDPEMVHEMAIGERLGAAAAVAQPELLPLLACRGAEAALTHGVSERTMVTFGGIGVLLCTTFGRVEAAEKYNRFALELTDRFPDDPARGRVQLHHAAFVQPWMTPLEETLEPLTRAYEACFACGDWDGAAQAVTYRASYLWLSGRSLATVIKDVDQWRSAIADLNQVEAVQYIDALHQHLLNLTGQADDPARLKGSSYDIDVMLPEHERTASRRMLNAAHGRQAMLKYQFGDPAGALPHADLVREHLPGFEHIFDGLMIHYFDALTRLAVAATASGRARRRLLRQVQASRRQIGRWAERAQFNALAKKLTVDAEWHRIHGREDRAQTLYDAAVDAARRHDMPSDEAIAHLFDQDNGAQIYQQLVGSLPDPITQMYRIASLANLDLEREQAVLACDDAISLLREVHRILLHEQKVTELRRQIAQQARDDMESQQREHLLRQQKRAIEQALGEDEDDEDVRELKESLDEARLPEAVQKEVDRELKRLARMSVNAADYQVARAYLELVAELPWHQRTEDQLDLEHARRVLDEDHYGLEEVKSRILESLAVLQLNPESHAPILCLVGPPGVGKTSLGQSIARAMGRRFERLSLGGLHDEGELRGHRRTYIGAMPGRIIQGVRRAGVTNPILMLDEIDKLGRDFRGDPSAALMEILDPAQNKDFRDNYLNLPYDLSGVFFITTANTLEGIARPLLDRMEVLELSGYSDQEKRAIARRYLIPRQQREAGLTEAQLDIGDEALDVMIRRNTREAGVRELERVAGRLARKRARQVVDGETVDSPIGAGDLTALLGPEKFKRDLYRETLTPGVAAGLAWTEAGGEVLYVETALTQKDDKVSLTGHLGQVMQESARAARSYLWSVAEQVDIDRDSIDNHGIHVHVPEGAVPKDGPSAGVTIAVALVSAYRHRPARADVAMTGEITLRGRVLPIGGLKEKLLAALRAPALEGAAIDNSKDPVKFREDLINIAKTTLSSKLVYHEKQYFAELAVNAVLRLQGSGNIFPKGRDEECIGLLAVRPSLSVARIPVNGGRCRAG